MYPCFGLTLMVTHACNMRCSYCYARGKSPRVMPEEIGRRAIDRAFASLEPGGRLELGFFGGEPLLEARLVQRLAEYAHSRAEGTGTGYSLTLTTNGTVTTPAAWAVMRRADMALAVSFDGLPELHDRHRRCAGGRGTSRWVLQTMRRLLGAGEDFRAVTVVRPDTVDRLAEGLDFMRDIGLRRVDLTLDLWAKWRPRDAASLERAIGAAARVWRDALPGFSVNWFDEKAGCLAGLSVGQTARCGFGDGGIAVAPSGHLYPCERLIDEDCVSSPMRIPGHALQGHDFLAAASAPPRCAEACSTCPAESLCNTFCRCSNYVRTGNVATPDRLLCLWNQSCLRETARALEQLRAAPAPA